MSPGVFVGGTDTDIGKTFVSALLSRHLSDRIETYYYKPVQAGEPTDASTLESLGGGRLKIYPTGCQLAHPMSPNRAATLENVDLSLAGLRSHWNSRPSRGFFVVEGAGGLLVPINDKERVIDLPKDYDLPVVLVSSTRLGTINHTLLSVEALRTRNIPCLGIILNGEEDPGLRETLQEQTGLQVLFEVPHLSEVTERSVADFAESSQEFRHFIDRLAGQVALNTEPKIDWAAMDKETVWHPFTQHGIVKNHHLVEGGRGASLKINGEWVIDAISSWWVNLFGHCQPDLVAAAQRQLQELEHVIFAGFTHEPAIELSQKLTALTSVRGAPLQKVFFSDNGSTAVEVAIKMAWQRSRQDDPNKKRRLLAFRGSYHGDTLGAMSVGEREGFNQVFTPLMFPVDFVDPFSEGELNKAFDQHGSEYFAVIVEPMVQGASGMRMYGAELLNQLSQLANDYGVPVIADEVFTGFYRTGKMFAFEHSELRPDFLCLSKGITGGFLPLAVTMTSNAVYDAFMGDDMRSAFLHGHSYTANPVACRVACETLKLLSRAEQDILRIQEQTAINLERLQGHVSIHQPRQLGTIGAFEVHTEDPNYFKGDYAYQFLQKATARGVLLRPLGGTIYTVPPYCTTNEEIEKIYQVIHDLLKEEDL